MFAVGESKMKRSSITKKTKSTETSRVPGNAAKATQFEIYLQQQCIEHDCNVKIIGNVITAEPKPGDPWIKMQQKFKIILENVMKVYFVFQNFERDGLIEKIYIKHEQLSREFLHSLSGTFEKYNTITTLKLQYCGLNIEDLDILQCILTEYSNIVDVNIDGNPNLLQNYYLLLINTRVRYLSLKRCKINEHGIKYLCSELNFGASNLEVLNLTGNFIDDKAVSYLAQTLRENRELTALILTDNWITDIGLKELMSTFQIFILTHNEILVRRNIIIEYCIQRIVLMKQYKDNQSFREKDVTEKSLTKFRKIRKSKSRSVSFTSKTVEQTEDELTERYVEEYLEKSQHPFVIDCYVKDGEINCYGNFNVLLLNLAYNKITAIGYKYIIDALNYHLSNEIQVGLLCISLEGNQQQGCAELEDIKRLQYEQGIKMLPKEPG